MNTTEQCMGIKDDKAAVSPPASSVNAAPTAGGVTAPGVPNNPAPPFPKWPCETLESMAEIGEAFMDALPEGYSWLQSPAEVIADLQNESYDAEQERRALVAALQAQEAASALDDEYQELQERAAEEGWANDPTGSVQLQDAGSRASNALNLAVQLRRAALKAAKAQP